MKRRMVGSFLLFAGIGFGPVVLGYLLFLFFWVGAFTLLRDPANPALAGLAPILWGLALPVLFALVSLAAYALYRRARHVVARLGVLYVGWLLLCFLPAFLLASMFAGVSMAVVDGATGGWALTLQELTLAAQLLVPLHLLIVPWVLLAGLVMLPRVSLRT